MMEAFPISVVAVLLCVVASIVIGSLWYGPLFGKPWMAMMGYTPEKMAAMKNDPKAKAKMTQSYVGQTAGSFLMAYVLSHVLVFASAYTGSSGVSAGLSSAFWTWIGFVVPVLLGSVLWENRPWKLFWINATHYLAYLVVSGVILSCWLK